MSNEDNRSGVVAILVAALLLLPAAAGCGGSEGSSQDPVIRVLASWTGRELEAFERVLEPFEAQTGFRVEYEASRDLPGSIRTAIEQGRPPDIAGLVGPQHMEDLAKAGSLRDLGQSIDLRGYKLAVAPTFIDLGTVDGRLVGVFLRSAVKGLIWYSPRVHGHEIPLSWSDLELMIVQMGATRPWCLGLASQESSGWPGTDWIENFLIRQAGPDTYDSWVAGRLPWTSPEVTRAWKSYGRIAGDGVVFGGVDAALNTPFEDAGEPLFTDPPGCTFLNQGSFMPTFWQESGRVPGVDFDFFPFPEIDPAFSRSVIGGGDLFGLLSDKQAAARLMAYLVGEEAQSIWASAGGTLSVHRAVTGYPDAIAGKAAATLVQADEFRFDGSDLMPAELNAAFWKAVLDYTREPARLTELLEGLEAIRGREHGS